MQNYMQSSLKLRAKQVNINLRTFFRFALRIV